MTDTEVRRHAAPPAGAEPWALAGRELASRLILGTGGVQSLDVLRRGRRGYLAQHLGIGHCHPPCTAVTTST